MALLIQRIADLIVKHLREELTEQERIELQEWVEQNDENRKLFNQLTTTESLQSEMEEYYSSRERVLEKIESGIEAEVIINLPVRQSWKRYVAIVATLIIICGAGYLWYQHSSPVSIATTPTPTVQQLSDIKAGGSKATLTLENGHTIILDSVADGMMTGTGDARIEKLNGELAYHSTSVHSTDAAKTDIAYNTLRTPLKGTYKLRLSDGSFVWLNAGSSIKYPNVFTGAERVVEITGEAYFEVAHNAAMPFIVKKTNSDISIRVLGTHFNVNAYDDEAHTKITLLEGSVRVVNGQSSILKPGQQAQIRDNSIRVLTDVDTEESVAWKNGFFQFSSADLGTVLRQAARWYDIEVSFPEGMPVDKFNGPIPRNVNLKQFLEILELSEVKFQLKEGRKLVVQHKH